MGTTFGEHLEELLGAGGVEVVFGIPGGQTLPLYLGAQASGRRQIIMRDERNAACAADAYARLSGKVGVCDATVGPGATNLVSGLAEAYASSVPVLAIVADIRREAEHLRRHSIASQATSQAELLAPVAKWIGRVQRARALEDVLSHALRIAVTGRPGPVVLEIPEDVFLGAADAGPGRSLTPADLRYPRHRSAPAPEALAAAVAAIVGASRPLLLAGGGVHGSRAADTVADLAEATGLPVATTINGKGTIDERHRLAAGVVGVFGNAEGNAALAAADVVVAIGTKLDQLSTHSWRLPRPDQTLVHIDIDGAELGRSIPAAVEVVADAGEAASALRGALAAQGWQSPEWLGSLPAAVSPGTPADDDAVAPEEVVRAIDRRLGPGDVLVSDASLASGWASAHYRVKQSGVGLVAPRGLAGIGWSPGAAIGARFATEPGKRVVTLAGDGAWGFGPTEVETAVRAGLDLVYVILDNAALGWVTHAEAHAGVTPSATFGDIDFAAVARAMGAGGTVVTDADELDGVLATALEGGVHLIDVRTSAAASPTLSYGKVRDGAYR